MSEYEYHEFQTVDRRLSENKMRELRSCSTRTIVTPTSSPRATTAVPHVVDLRDLAVHKGAETDFSRRLAMVRAARARKPSLIPRLQDRGLC